MIYLTSDTHYGHDNILKYCPMRPYENAHKMNKGLQEEYNKVVGDSDEVFIIGDFCLSKNPELIKAYLDNLNGGKHLILGNHDELKPFQYVDCGFLSVHTSLRIGNFYANHDPSMGVALKEGDVLLHGHVHQMWKHQITDNKVHLYNVGVDVHNMKPISLEQIKKEIGEKNG